MRIGDKYTHAKGGEYVLMGSVKIKNSSTREWTDGVIYMKFPLDKTGPNLHYVREEHDFRKRFKKICNPVHPA